MMSAANLRDRSRDGLIEQYANLLGTPLPARLSTPLLLRIVAYESQAVQSGGLPHRLRKRLRAIAREDKPVTPAVRLNRDARLVRDWNGVSHVVDRIEGGFAYRGRTYRSLSAIAREITGAKWSGPRFFGLRPSA